MEEIVDDLKKVKFTSSNQFLIGEKVKILSYTPNNSTSNYGEYINRDCIVYGNLTYTIVNNYSDYSSISIYDPISNNTLLVNVIDLDLAIEDGELYKEIKNIRLSQYKLYLNYRVKEVEILKKRFYEHNKDILNIFEEVYPNQYDYSFDQGKLSCIIHFPEITITNSEKRSHKIVDLYMKIVFKPNKTIYSFNGTRATLTLAERNSGYRHSHIGTSGNFHSWLSCCMGESEFAQTYSLLCNSFNKDNLTRFLYQLPEYLSWESLEGGPYRKMSEISTSNNTPGSVQLAVIDSVYKKLLAEVVNIPVKLNKEFIDIFQIENSQLEELILPFAGNHICNKIGTSYVLDSSSVQTNSQVSSYNAELNNVTMFTYKGKLIKPKVIASLEGEQTNGVIKAPYPSLTAGISSILTKKLNEYVISEANI